MELHSRIANDSVSGLLIEESQTAWHLCPVEYFMHDRQAIAHPTDMWVPKTNWSRI